MPTQFVQAGVCDVTYGGVTLGLTKGGVKFAMTVSTYQIQVDQFGDAVIDEFIKGRAITVTVPMAESDVAKLVRVIPGATLVGGTLTVPSSAGLSMRTLALPLILHPHGAAPTDHTFDITVPLAAPKGAFSFEFKMDSERLYSIDFTGFVDLTTGNLFYFGPAPV